MSSEILSRSLVFAEGSSNKFWKIELNGSSHTVVFGRVGTTGQTKTNDFDDAAAARKSYDKLVAEKTKKGYVDADGASGQASSSPITPTSTAAAPATKAKAATKPRKSKTGIAAESESESSATQTTDSPNIDDTSADVNDRTTTSAGVEFNVSSERSLGLSPLEMRRAAFRSLPPLELETPRPFDQEACFQRLEKLKVIHYGWDLNWSDLKLPRSLSHEEAHFWLLAMSHPRNHGEGVDSNVRAMRKQTGFDRHLNMQQIRELLLRHNRAVHDDSMLAVANLVTPEVFFVGLLEPVPETDSPWEGKQLQKQMTDAFNRFVVPYLSELQRNAFREQIRQQWKPPQIPSHNELLPTEYYLAGSLGLPDLVYQVTSILDPKRYASFNPMYDYYEHPQELVFGLGSEEDVAAEWRRLSLHMTNARDVRSFLACTGYSALDCIAGDIIKETNRERCDELLKPFTQVLAPEAAEPMLHCRLTCKSAALARQWLETNLAHSIAGLIPTAAGKGKLSEAALEFLRDQKSKGHSAVIEQALQRTDNPEGADRIRAEVIERQEKIYAAFDDGSAPEWLTTAINNVGTIKRKTLPSWATPATLPPLVIGDHRLSDKQIDLVLQLLAATPITTKHPFLLAVREHVPRLSRDEFAWKLFHCWSDDACPSKEKWAMGAIGHLGDDGCVRKITPLIRIWPGESQHARAVFGLECLRAIGSSVALMQLSGIAQKLKFKGLKSKAEAFVTEIAQERGLTRDELEDRVVPDCGLDESGRREFPFGTRFFSFVLSSDLKPMVRDEAGKLRPNLPDPNSKDDAALAAESLNEWKLMKKQIKDVATIQAARLEQAMVTGRRWAIEDFESLLVRHPLLTHLVQKLIWAGFDAAGERIVTFRVTEERDYADPNDDTISLNNAIAVGIVHPLDLSDAERSRWGEVLGDYEVVPPFPQLGRANYALDSNEADATDLNRFQGLKLVAPTLVFTLEKLGWTRGVGMDGGGFDEHSKQFPAANVTAVAYYEGSVAMGYIDPNEILKVESVHFCAGMRAPSGYGWESKNKLKLGQVAPVVISEVIADLQVIKGKAK